MLLLFTSLLIFFHQEAVVSQSQSHDLHQPLSKVAIHNTLFALHPDASIKASPNLLGFKGQNTEWVTLKYNNPNPSIYDWIGVFSPANFRYYYMFRTSILHFSTLINSELFNVSKFPVLLSALLKTDLSILRSCVLRLSRFVCVRATISLDKA